jgi:hypothetical protein
VLHVLELREQHGLRVGSATKLSVETSPTVSTNVTSARSRRQRSLV